MKHALPAFLAFLAVTSVFACRPSLSADSAVDVTPAEMSVRKADADWAAAANSANIDAWMAFYAADAIVVLPNDQLASGEELLRQSVSRLLARPHLSVASRPVKVEVARSGEVALLNGTYELRFRDSKEAPVSDRGRRVEIWRRQAGIWKCIVDTWMSDQTVTPPSPAAAASAQGASPAVGSVAPITQTAPPARHGTATTYGDMPTDYQEAIRQYFLEHLKYPDSVQYREITQPEQGYTTAVTGALLMHEKREYGWKVKATINAKNSHDKYVGFKTYMFLFRGEKIVDARLPLPEDEMN
jgi:ketosteroid isomerase-like protein